MSEVEGASEVRAQRFRNATPRPDKYVEPDGSIQTRGGVEVSPASEVWARRYMSATPRPNKFLNPDGSISTGGGGGGVQVIQVADQATALAQSQANPNNIYWWA